MIDSFLLLLAAHWVGDFVLQTHWQASNKSKNLSALSRHVLVYSACIGLAALFMYGPTLAVLEFFVANFILHLITDAVTSRITSKLFLAQFDKFGEEYGGRLLMKKNFNPHNFFVVIGYDQLIHQATLAWTMKALL